jgi:electron transfer flavoprotein alpha/beta subunit
MAEVVLKLPAVICVQSGIQRLHYLSTGRLRKARKIPIPLGGSIDADVAAQTAPGLTAYEIKEASYPSRESHAEMITGGREEKAAAVLEIVTKIV